MAMRAITNDPSTSGGVRLTCSWIELSEPTRMPVTAAVLVAATEARSPGRGARGAALPEPNPNRAFGSGEPDGSPTGPGWGGAAQEDPSTNGIASALAKIMSFTVNLDVATKHLRIRIEP